MKFLIAQALLKDDSLTESPTSDTCIEGDTVTTAASNSGEGGNNAG